MQTHHIAAFLKGFHAVLRADDDRLCPKGQYQRPRQQDRADRTVHFRHLVGQQYKPDQDIHRVAGVDGFAQRFGCVHSGRLPGICPAARV